MEVCRVLLVLLLLDGFRKTQKLSVSAAGHPLGHSHTKRNQLESVCEQSRKSEDRESNFGCDFTSLDRESIANHLFNYHSEEELKQWCINKELLGMYIDTIQAGY